MHFWSQYRLPTVFLAEIVFFFLYSKLFKLKINEYADHRTFKQKTVNKYKSIYYITLVVEYAKGGVMFFLR